MGSFRIQDTDFEAHEVSEGMPLTINSSPRRYAVEFAQDSVPMGAVERVLLGSQHGLLLVDEAVLRLHGMEQHDFGAPTMAVSATEEFKSVDGAFSVVDFLDRERASRTSMLIAVGGGIVQDVAAFAACVYKRGVPWTYVPTTLLAQADSCIGAKSGLNYKGAKNLIGVFCAPRQISLHTGFLATLPHEDLLSGMGEIFRLSIIGGREALDLFAGQEHAAIAGETRALGSLTRSALAIKRAVIERDEHELDLRRSMNFGHSIGHALEALTNHQIPHGIAVAVGVLVESEISCDRALLSDDDRLRLLELGGPVIPERVRSVLESVSLDDLLDVLFRDKKVEGSNLKLVVPVGVGQIRFVDLPLEPATVPLVGNALTRVLSSLS